MNTPEIKIDGKKYIPSKPKAGVWREIMEFDEGRKQILAKEFIDEHAKIIAKVFSMPQVTPDSIMDNLAIEDIVPLYFACFGWICGQINSKLEQLPNLETPTPE